MSSYQNLSTTGRIVDMAAKPVLNGAVVYLGAKMLGAEGLMSTKFGGNYSTPAALGIGGIVSSFGTELAHQFILPHVLPHNKLGQMESMIAAPLINGSILALYAGMNDSYKTAEIGNMKLLALGAASEVASTYGFETFLRPWFHK